MAFIKAIVIVAFIANSGQLIKDIEQAVNQVYEVNGAEEMESRKCWMTFETITTPYQPVYATQPLQTGHDMWAG